MVSLKKPDQVEGSNGFIRGVWYTFLSSPLLLCWLPSIFLKFEITEVWPISLFILSVCISQCLQVRDAWREGEGLSLRHHCLHAPPRGSGVGKRGLNGPECIELLSESWFCTYWPYYNINSFKANAKQQSLQQSGFHSGPGTEEFAFCTCWFYCC